MGEVHQNGKRSLTDSCLHGRYWIRQMLLRSEIRCTHNGILLQVRDQGEDFKFDVQVREGVKAFKLGVTCLLQKPNAPLKAPENLLVLQDP